ncbi:MAG: stage II sporulation protein E, partial [Hymenobacteraceae bacterium]|nr:stage II sporulation protein E [Hymenobacteraceae bacterium]
MGANAHQKFSIHDRSFASIAKRDITRLAESLGFSESEVGRVNIVVSELITNLIKFSKNGGELLVKP